MYSAGFYPYETLEEHWAYWSRYIFINRYQNPPKPVYQNLFHLVQSKDYFVLTTNVDHCFQKAGFDKQRLFYTQGDYGLWQCSKPCHNRTYDNETVVKRMVREQKAMRVPSELVPYCPLCGAPMSMNLRADSTFVEDAGWNKAANRYQNFLRQHKGQHILYLELGVGENTPGIIKYPFWNMTHQNANATYARSIGRNDLSRLCRQIFLQKSNRNPSVSMAISATCCEKLRRSGKHHCAGQRQDNPLSVLPRASVASASVRRTPLSAKPNGPQPQAIV